jgi:hypothetical protein
VIRAVWVCLLATEAELAHALEATAEANLRGKAW